MAVESHVNFITPTLDGCSYGAGWSSAVSPGTKRSYASTTNPPPLTTPSRQNEGTGDAPSGNWTSSRTGHGNDTIIYFQVHYFDSASDGFSAVTNFKTNALAATMPAPGSSAVTATTATITSNTYTPAVNASTYTVSLYYKKTTDPTYTFAASGTTNPLTANLTGLDSSTQYQFYAEIVRTTNNDKTLASSVGSFTTLAGEPEVTTVAASSVAHTSAVLNGTLDINSGTGVNVYFVWDTVTPPVANQTANQSKSADGNFAQAISGLSADTLYYFQAFVSFSTPTGSPNEGSILSFTTTADPAAEAADEDHMTIQEYDAVYGVQKAFVFLAASPSATSSNIFLSAAAPWATTECRITIDGGAVADCTNAPTRIGTSAFYTITLTAAELSGENIWVHINDTGAAARDVALHIRTSLQLGKMVLDASQMTNTTALLATGIGSGHGISAVGGATGLDIDGVLGQHVMRFNTATAGGASTITLDASASATNDYYNGALIMIVGGTGAGQGRVITDYVGSTLVATVNKAWATNPASGSVFVIVPGDDPWEVSPGAELSALPTYASSYAKMLHFLFQRFVYKRTQTATVFTTFKDDASTSLATGGVTDNGTTQTHDELA